jgi:hypothetical protein
MRKVSPVRLRRSYAIGAATAALASLFGGTVIMLATFGAASNGEMWTVCLATIGLLGMPASEWIFGTQDRRAKPW